MVAQTQPPNQRAPAPARAPPLFVSFPPTTALAFTQPKLRQATKSPDQNRLGPKELAPKGHKLFCSTGSRFSTPAKRPTLPMPPSCPLRAGFVPSCFKKKNTKLINRK